MGRGDESRQADGIKSGLAAFYKLCMHFIYFPWDSRNWPWWFSGGPMWAVAEKDQRAVFLTKPLQALVGHGDVWLGQNASWLPKFRVLLFCADVMNEGYKDLRIPLFLWRFLLPLSSAFKKTWLPWGNFWPGGGGVPVINLCFLHSFNQNHVFKN